MSAGWDAAVTRAARAFYDAFPAVRSTRRRGPEPQSYFDLPDHARHTWQSHARAALTAAVGPGGRILEAADVADLLLVLDGIDGVASCQPEDAVWSARDRLRVLLTGAGAG